MAKRGKYDFHGAALPDVYVCVGEVSGGARNGGWNAVLEIYPRPPQRLNPKARFSWRDQTERGEHLTRQMLHVPYQAGAEPYALIYAAISAQAEFAGMQDC